MNSLRESKQLGQSCARLGKRLLTNKAEVSALLDKLSKLDTASLCDADKSMVTPSDSSYRGLKLIQGLVPLNKNTCKTMVGIARTVQCKEPNDFLAVLQGLEKAKQDEVLVVNTCDSTRAVAGELFCAEASRRGVRGILVDGPMRDTAYLDEFSSVRCYSKSVTPYSGTIQSVGETQVTVICGGAKVSPGDVVVGDNDGIVVGSMDTFAKIVDAAYNIQKVEGAIKRGIAEGKSLHSLTNYKQHLKARAAGKDSSLTFNV